MSGILVVQDIFDDYFLMKILEFMGNIGGGHVGSPTLQNLRDLFLITYFSNIKVEIIKLNCFW